MSEIENQLGLGTNRNPAFVGAKRTALHPRGRSQAVLYNSIYRTKVGSHHGK